MAPDFLTMIHTIISIALSDTKVNGKCIKSEIYAESSCAK